jgi:CheY-like chemotaxis protein
MMEALTVRPVDLVLVCSIAALLGAAAGYLLRGWLGERVAPSIPPRAPLRSEPRVAPAAHPPRATWATGVTWGAEAAGRSGAGAEAGVVAGGGEGGGPMVLIVDDRFELRAINGAYLRGHGYRVREAADGEAALAAVRGERPDVILLDHSLPHRTGLEVLRELKADPETARIPVVFMTAHSYGAVGRSAVAAGCAAFLSKPVDPSRVMLEVARHVGRPARA